MLFRLGCRKRMYMKKVRFSSTKDYLEEYGFKHVNDTYLVTIPKGYDYGDTDFHYYTSPLYEATKRGDLGLVELLLQEGADPNMNPKERSPVLHTVMYGSLWDEDTTKILTLLIKYGANVNSKSKNDGSTPLHIAAFFWDNKYAEQIIEIINA